MDSLKTINAGIAFILELAMFTCYGLWGYSLSNKPLICWLATIGAVGLIIIVWAIFAAPGAVLRPHGIGLYLLQSLLLIGAFSLFYKLHHGWPAAALIAIAIISQCIAYAYRQ